MESLPELVCRLIRPERRVLGKFSFCFKEDFSEDFSGADAAGTGWSWIFFPDSLEKTPFEWSALLPRVDTCR
jgi:hypothetical protein